MDVDLEDLGPLVIRTEPAGWVRIERIEGRLCSEGLLTLDMPHARQLRDWLNENVRD